MSGGRALAVALLALSTPRLIALEHDEAKGFKRLEAIWTEERKKDLAAGPGVLAPDAGARWKALVARVRARAHAELKDEEFPNLTPAQFGDLGERLAADSSKLARSVEAAATNSAAVGLIERSGLIDKLALALQGQKFLSADETAVTLNLNALALFGRPGQDPRPGLSRLGGSITFGAKLPQKEIVGFSGLPDPDKLLDALSWDVKLRLLGDRDPRAREWARYQWADTAILQLDAIAVADLPAVQSAIQELGNAQVERALGRSMQASLKFSGQHLTREAGMNKYSGTLMFDAGLGHADFTLNATYSAVRDVKLGNGLPVTLKQWKLAAGISATLARDLIVEGRGTELTLSGEALVPRDGSSVPLDRKTTWKADASLKFPITATTHVPISITWTNDPNNLAKSKYVRGQLGISYDFKSLVQLAKGGDKPAVAPGH